VDGFFSHAPTGGGNRTRGRAGRSQGFEPHAASWRSDLRLQAQGSPIPLTKGNRLAISCLPPPRRAQPRIAEGDFFIRQYPYRNFKDVARIHSVTLGAATGLASSRSSTIRRRSATRSTDGANLALTKRVAQSTFIIDDLQSQMRCFCCCCCWCSCTHERNERKLHVQVER
jgi:hypothetical protein